MREDESNWFSKWEDELPPPEELISLSQSLITPDLALAFNISNPHQTHAPPPQQSAQPNSSAELDSPELSGAGGSDEPARILKRPRLAWTPQLHKRFVDAVAHLGIKNVVPKTIMQLMSVDGLTRENVASHLQKYRLYLKRMQSISNGGGDAATDHLFASSPVPAHFLHSGRVNPDHFLSFVPAPSAAMHHRITAAHHHP
ncbi:transcription factor lux [Phtheirospermum japonicum]|uniref:Transcription factor lux n=1 Tax=Phtheirospermum japonicum TaxID=374723 RepID=A0A830BR11_9LAMI|nr:transcription factor lux [Phtheirospermum japonicum]